MKTIIFTVIAFVILCTGSIEVSERMTEGSSAAFREFEEGKPYVIYYDLENTLAVRFYSELAARYPDSYKGIIYTGPILAWYEMPNYWWKTAWNKVKELAPKVLLSKITILVLLVTTMLLRLISLAIRANIFTRKVTLKENT